MTAATSDTRQDRNGRMIRIGSKVHDHFHDADGTVEATGKMCWIRLRGRASAAGVNYEDVEVLP